MILRMGPATSKSPAWVDEPKGSSTIPLMQPQANTSGTNLVLLSDSAI